MKKLLFVSGVLFIVALSLVGCSPSATEETAKFTVMPEGLKDCKIYRITPTGGDSLNVVRCPLSNTTTSYSSGKTTTSVSVTEQPSPAASTPELKIDAVVINGQQFEVKK